MQEIYTEIVKYLLSILTKETILQLVMFVLLVWGMIKTIKLIGSIKDYVDTNNCILHQHTNDLKVVDLRIKKIQNTMGECPSIDRVTFRWLVDDNDKSLVPPAPSRCEVRNE